MPRLLPWHVYWKKATTSLFFSLFHPLLVLVNYNGVRIEREWNFSGLLLSSWFSSFSMTLKSKVASHGVRLG
jgi:hypothetical protein